MSRPESATLKPGDQAPLFTLPNQKGVRCRSKRRSRTGPCCWDSTGARGDRTAVAGSATWRSTRPLPGTRGHGDGVVAQRSEKVRRYIEETGLAFDILIDDARDTVKRTGCGTAWL